MNIRDLEYYQQIISQKNFSKVADSFHVSQPTITTALKRLEAELGAQLIVRDHSKNQLRITACGEQLAEHAQRILNEWSLTQQEIEHLSHDQVTLGLPPILENYYFPKVAAALREKRLLAGLTPLHEGSNALRKDLQRGRIDISLLGSAEPMSYATLVTEEFDRNPFNIFVSKKHPLANRKRVYFSELKDEAFILFNSSFVHNQAFNTMARRNRFRPEIIYRANATHIIMSMVAENIGVTFLTSLAD